jgi:hypothetical protein
MRDTLVTPVALFATGGNLPEKHAMPRLDEVLKAGWDFECQGINGLAGERWKRYRSRLLPSLVKLARWCDKQGTPLTSEYLFDGQLYKSVAAAVAVSNEEPE